MSDNQSNKGSDFATLLEESFKRTESLEGQVVIGTIVNIKDDKAIIDVGLKSEGRLLLSDIKALKDNDEVKIGDTLPVYIEKFEDKWGNPILSIERAQKEAVWNKLESCMEKGEVVDGIIVGRTKGGFSVDISGTIAFLPGSQVDLRIIKDITPLINVKQQFKILKMDKSRNNIVVSRRAVLEVERNLVKDEVLSKLEEGMVIEGIVKNITEYGVFVDIGGIDGLLHITDMSWKRISLPSDLVKVGDIIKVQVIKFNKESGRVSLGMKQLMKTPWENGIDEKYKVGEKYKGKVVNITDYGVFVELEDCIEGMVYKSEISWNRNINPSKVVGIGDEVEVKVLEVNAEKHKISLSIKECQPNPCVTFAEEHPVGSRLKGVIKGIREFGIFVSVTDTLDGTVAMRDITWDISYDEELNRNGIDKDARTKNYEVGQEIEVIVLGIETKKEIIRLGIKQLTSDPYAKALSSIHKDDIVNATVSKVTSEGMEVKLDNGLPCLIKRMDIGYENNKRLSDYKIGDKVEALVVNVNPDRRYVLLSIKALEIKNEKDVLKKLKSETNKSTLGDVLGDVLKK